MPNGVIDSSWIQTGELGFAFVVVVLCSALVAYVVKSSSAREAKLIEIITTQTPLLQQVANSLNSIISKVDTIEEKVNRIEALEKSVSGNIKIN